MMYLDISVFLIVCTFLTASALYEGSYCFKYTWRGNEFEYATNKNCSKVKNAPCIDPVLTVEPNTTKFWDNALRGDESKICKVQPDDVCIKYTFSYNNAIVNTSSFCGKMIENQMIAITTGCYYQKVDGYVVETCACQSGRMDEPCNASGKMEYSMLFILIVVLLAAVNSIEH